MTNQSTCSPPEASEYLLSGLVGDSAASTALDKERFLKEREHRGISTFSVSFYVLNKFKKLINFVSEFPNLSYQFIASDRVKIYDADHLIIAGRNAGEIHVDVYGDREFCDDLRTRFSRAKKNIINLTWWYCDDGECFNDRRIPLDFPNEGKDEYYPYIKEGLKGYYDQYNKSTAPILLCMGEPGTGKTSFIKEYIRTFKCETVVTYDPKIMASDFFYIQYLIDTEKTLLVIEDADILLQSRETEANPAMAKLLNISDGLIKLETKKIIFSTNITDYSRIDSALIRPGRCFDVVNFRKLRFDEAKAACKAAGMDEVTDSDKDYSLSEIFNQRAHTFHGERFGFLGR